MGKGVANASIVLLLGTSTAGKSTLCREILEQNKNLPDDQKLDWQVSGHDIAVGELCLERNKRFLVELKDDPRFQKIQELSPKFNEVESLKPLIDDPNVAKLYHAICEKALTYNGQTLKFLEDKDFDEKDFDEKIAKFLQVADPNQEFFNKEVLWQLRSLAVERSEFFHAVVDEVFRPINTDFFEKRRYEEVLFEKAIASSKAGKPILLDVVPDRVADGKGSSTNIAERFEKYCAAQGHSCPIHVAVMHLPVRDLADRMEKRNVEAIERGEKTDVRNDLGYILQYPELYRPSSGQEGERKVAELTVEDVEYAIAKFSKAGREENTVEENKAFQEKEESLKEKLGFGDKQEASKGKAVEVVAIPPFDRIYDVASKESTAEIAKKICALATDKSLTPLTPAPFVAEMKSGSELFQEQLATVDFNKPSSSIQALEAKVLDKQREALQQDGSK